MSGDLPAVEQPGSLAPTYEAWEREREQVEIRRRRAGDAVREKEAAEERERKAPKAIEKLQTELGTVKADIERALSENEKYQPKAPRASTPL
ncbi:unnamed protein product [Ectocarpus sp. 12 AP-2014]